MRGKRAIHLLFAFMLCASIGQAQTDAVVFEYKKYIADILKQHPIAKQADLKEAWAEAEWLGAKGNFDPVLSSGWNEKKFDDKLYYRQFMAQAGIPTRTPIDIVAGYENTEGVFLNPENTTDRFGLWNVGIEANILQGLVTDERRTALRQAKIFRNIAANQRRIILNDLLFSATAAYIEWQRVHYIQEVINESIAVANTYFENTKIAFLNGEKTGMDTLEALIIRQDRVAALQANTVRLIKAKQNIESYLWQNDLPLGLQPIAQPEKFEETIFSINANIDANNLSANTPIVQEKINKQKYFEMGLRLKRQKLLPKLKIKYHPLLHTSNDGITPNFSTSDYKWGFDFFLPLFLRSERAAIQKGEIKIRETILDIQNKQNELRIKMQASLEQQSILAQQLDLQEQNVAGYEKLLDAENEKFLFGESSVFLLNKRQEKYIDGQIKLIELRAKYQFEITKYLYYANELEQRIK